MKLTDAPPLEGAYLVRQLTPARADIPRNLGRIELVVATGQN